MIGCGGGDGPDAAAEGPPPPRLGRFRRRFGVEIPVAAAPRFTWESDDNKYVKSPLLIVTLDIMSLAQITQSLRAIVPPHLDPDAVGGLVPLEVRLLAEGLVAEGAVEGPDVLVHAHVHHQVVRLAERLAAHLAVLEHPVARLVVPGA